LVFPALPASRLHSDRVLNNLDGAFAKGKLCGWSRRSTSRLLTIRVPASERGFSTASIVPDTLQGLSPWKTTGSASGRLEFGIGRRQDARARDGIPGHYSHSYFPNIPLTYATLRDSRSA